MSNASSSFDDLIEEISSKPINFLIGIILFVCVFSEIFVFPIYVYVKNKNREKDLATVVFPIEHHFSKAIVWMICLSNLTLFLSVVEAYLVFAAPLLSVLVGYILLLMFSVINVFSEVQHLLLFLMALQRFLLYFFPETEKFISFSPVFVEKFIKCLYIIVASKTIGMVAWTAYLLMTGLDSSDYADKNLESVAWKTILTSQIIYILITNSLLLTAAFLYIPMFISIRNLSHLASAVASKPHKYIVYQVILIITFKIISLAILASISREYYDAKQGLWQGVQHLIYASIGIDCYMTPYIMQITYLFCNRRNVETIFNKLNCWKKLSSVEPTLH